MTTELIYREELDAGRVDFTDLRSGERVPANRITTILAGQRAITAETALRLSRHFGTSASFWLGLQKAYELEVAERAAGDRIRQEVSPREAAQLRESHKAG